MRTFLKLNQFNSDGTVSILPDEFESDHALNDFLTARKKIETADGIIWGDFIHPGTYQVITLICNIPELPKNVTTSIPQVNEQPAK
jgi:hypothetical protein